VRLRAAIDRIGLMRSGLSVFDSTKLVLGSPSPLLAATKSVAFMEQHRTLKSRSEHKFRRVSRPMMAKVVTGSHCKGFLIFKFVKEETA
jgi:hypothetical protein